MIKLKLTPGVTQEEALSLSASNKPLLDEEYTSRQKQLKGKNVFATRDFPQERSSDFYAGFSADEIARDKAFKLSRLMEMDLVSKKQIQQAMVGGSGPLANRVFSGADVDGTGYFSEKVILKNLDVLRILERLSGNFGPEEEYKSLDRMPHWSTYMEFALAEENPVNFEVAHDWHKVLSKAVHYVKHEEIELPFPVTCFEFTYMDRPMRGHVSQHPETHKVEVLGVVVSTMSADAATEGNRPWFEANEEEKVVFLEHVFYTCIALETELAGKAQFFLTSAFPDKPHLVKTTPKPHYTYKILPIRKKDKQIVSQPSAPTGIKQRFHIRRSHWKTIRGKRVRIKWYFAGHLELGFIVKDYLLD